jgi:hypothetical protein
MERTVLITNLMNVSIPTAAGKVQTHTNALALFDRGKDSGGPRYRMHGFQNEAGNMTFDMVIPSFTWSIDPLVIRPGWPTRNFILAIDKLDLQIELHTDFANNLPPDVARFDGEHDDWSSLLLRKVLRYYHAPYIMLGQQHDADHARYVFGVEGVSPP